ncbi:MAG: ribbon-helix-helix protein, CopG family [Acidimicrobiia bacterium]|nr:ribbon-helix-helix protein, CopG family [Acidimicrobiia bacterium]
MPTTSVLRFSVPTDLPPEAAGDRSAWLRSVFARRLDRRRRPLRTTQTRPVTVRLDDATIRAIDEAAAEAGVSRRRWMEMAVEAEIG